MKKFKRWKTFIRQCLGKKVDGCSYMITDCIVYHMNDYTVLRVLMDLSKERDGSWYCAGYSEKRILIPKYFFEHYKDQGLDKKLLVRDYDRGQNCYREKTMLEAI